MKYLTLFVLFILSSCAKEVSGPVSDISDERLAEMNAFMKGSTEVDFKHDYVLSNFTRAMLSPEERKMIQYASADPDIMLEKFPEVKLTISDWLKENKGNWYNRAIQITSLRYLRRFFLLDNQSAYVSEISFLLKILVDTKSIDLDVLADAFHYCNLDLSSSEQDRYFNYIKELHDNEIDVIRTNALKFKEKYENSTGPTKMKYLAYGKKMERRSKACLYTRALLGIELKSVD